MSLPVMELDVEYGGALILPSHLNFSLAAGLSSISVNS